MSNQPAYENRQILEEASAWFVEFRLGGLDGATRRDFMAWLMRSPEHIRAYIEISHAYARLPGATEVPNAEIERLIEMTRNRPTVAVLDGIGGAPPGASAASVAGAAGAAGIAGTAGAAGPTPARERVPSRRRLITLAASIAFCCVVAWAVLSRDPTYVTQTAEHRSITLEDGSRVELNARAKIRVRFTAAQRNVDLLAGQALFHVAKDPQRAFLVSSEGTRVRAVGTVFDVHQKASGTTVTVLEGRVAIQAPVSSGAASVGPVASGHTPSVGSNQLELAAGEQVIVTRTAVSKLRQANVSAATAWTKGELEFDETPLPEVIDEFNRYSRTPIVLESSALNEFLISGVYSSDDPRSLIRFLRNQPDLVVTETGSEIRIRPK
ncbi:MAG: FecR domain-containing protein [Gammaproteobacteria bacterium]